MIEFQSERWYEAWEWVLSRCPKASYRLKKIVHHVVIDLADRPGESWSFPLNDSPFYGSGIVLVRSIEPERRDGARRGDLEVFEIGLRTGGIPGRVRRWKMICVDEGSTYADLCRMLNINEQEIK